MNKHPSLDPQADLQGTRGKRSGTPSARTATNRGTRLAALALAASVLAGCATAPHAPDPEIALPTRWDEPFDADREAEAGARDWWASFGSTELVALIDTVLAGNPDLAIATERVLQAEIGLRNAGASLLPTLDFNAATSSSAANRREDRGERSLAGLAISYEIDVWGSNFSRRDGAGASLAATRFDYQATRLSLIASTANLYARLLALKAGLEIARKNAEISERLFVLVEARYRNGAASALDVSRQRTTLLATQNALLPLEIQIRESLRALAILTGQAPQGFMIAATDIESLTVPELGASLPGELLARRPDLAAAEARMRAADANIAVARAALFPLKLSIGAGASLSSSQFALAGLGDPFSSADITLSLLQAIFDGGRLRGDVEIAESQRRQAFELYRGTVLTSLTEVEDGLANVAGSRQQLENRREIRDETARALVLSELRYREGSDSLDTLLDAQRNLFVAEDTLIQQRFAVISATIDLYKALGGGWQRDEPAS
ncbi:MAG: efflux transporter outer membrane subunit [Zoogloeaceae bacterium]|nr:efflux transporter outer membrane subunit [Zoogloeaceae bacterium]